MHKCISTVPTHTPMKTLVLKVKSCLATLQGWEPNPILVKELRQAMRSRAFLGAFALLLAVLFGGSYIIVWDYTTHTPQSLGSSMFEMHLFILVLFSTILIPFYVAFGILTERNPSNIELMYYTTLSPWAIVRGKFFAGAYMAVLLFSVCMPFMSFSYFLRGVDLPAIFYTLFILFAVVCLAVMAAIFVAVLPVGRLFKGIIGLNLGLGLWMGTSTQLVLFLGYRELLPIKSTVERWLDSITLFLTYVGFLGLFYVGASTLISPRSSNRALPIRVFITAFWVVEGLLALAWLLIKTNSTLIKFWGFTTCMIMIPGLFVIISQNDKLSLRVRRQIPSSRLKRILAFLFFNGAAGGLIWTAIILSLTSWVIFATLLPSPKPTLTYTIKGAIISHTLSSEEYFVFQTLIAIAYAFAYVLTGLFVHRQFLPKTPPMAASVCAAMVIFVSILLPTLIMLILKRSPKLAFTQIQLGNFFNSLYVEYYYQLLAHLIFAMSWVLIAFLANLKWFINQVRSFRPIDDSPALAEAQCPTPNS